MQISHFKWIFWFLLIFLPHNSISQKCTFSLNHLPIPSNHVIYGDPRNVKKCQGTSIEKTRPKDLFNPDGLRMWTMEEHTVSESPDPRIRSRIEVMKEDPLMFGRFNRLVKNKVTTELWQYLNIMKCATSTMNRITKATALRKEISIFPQAHQVEFTLTVVRHPIARLVSGIGQLGEIREFII